MLGDALTKDVSVATEAGAKDGKYEVIVPVGLPDEGTYEWLDMSVAKNPGYTEISSRAMLKWMVVSGFNMTPGAVKCNEHPDIYFTLEAIDKGHLLRRMRAVAAMQRRNYVLMDVRNNLIADSREELLKTFSSNAFKKIAHVQLGDGNAEFKKKALEVALKNKQEASDKAFRAE